MKYIMTIIWSLLIGAAVSYVLTSMAEDPFSMTQTLVLAGIFAVSIIVMGEFLIKKEEN